jgi:uncharacterized protein with gpF-like domain
MKRWITRRDDRVREAHVLADGQTVPLWAPFTIGGFPAQYPQDPTLPPEQSANCRCRLILVDVNRQ